MTGLAGAYAVGGWLFRAATPGARRVKFPVWTSVPSDGRALDRPAEVEGEAGHDPAGLLPAV